METKLIYSKIPLVMAEIGAVGKDRKNTVQNYAFRGIDDFYNAIQPSLAKHKVFCVPKVLSSKREERTTQKGGNLIYTILEAEFTFFAEDGSSVSATTIGEAMDSGDKSANKAMSAAMKYALVQMFCIRTEENHDTEVESHEVKPSQFSGVVKLPQKPPQFVDDDLEFDPSQLEADESKYFVEFGKYEGQHLSEIDKDEIMDYCNYLVRKAKEKNELPSAHLNKLIQLVKEYYGEKKTA